MNSIKWTLSFGSSAELGPAYLLMLDVGALAPKLGMEVSGASRSFVLDGKVYVADGETFIINRYAVSAELELVRDGEMSVGNHGLTYFDTGWTFVDATTAYYMNGEQQGTRRSSEARWSGRSNLRSLPIRKRSTLSRRGARSRFSDWLQVAARIR